MAFRLLLPFLYLLPSVVSLGVAPRYQNGVKNGYRERSNLMFSDVLRPDGQEFASTTMSREVTLSMSTSNFISALSVRQLLTKKISTKTNHNAILALRGGATVLASTLMKSPPLSGWLFPAVCCATSYAMYNLFIKQAANANMDPVLGGVVLQIVAAGMGTLLWLGKKLATSQDASTASALAISKPGLLWSIAAGVAVGAAEILSFIVSGKGVPATQSIPIIVGGSILVGTILGAAWLQERLTRTGWFGVMLIAAGIVLVGIDPGSSMGH